MRQLVQGGVGGVVGGTGGAGGGPGGAGGGPAGRAAMEDELGKMARFKV